MQPDLRDLMVKHTGNSFYTPKYADHRWVTTLIDAPS
jgi:hypothetical protein